MVKGRGCPSVMLFGEKRHGILKRVGERGRYGKEAKEWSVLLTPVINNMINSFNKPKSEEVNDFWLKACYRK
jgi:hypothetical protein